MKYSKYHALGNDYLVMRPAEFSDAPDPETIRLICHRNYGIGSDGILLGPLPSQSCDFRLRIFNPDGTEAEKSGNGLRIFVRYLLDNNIADNPSFTVETTGGKVSCAISADGKTVTVEMGDVCFHSTMIPMTGPSREVLNEAMEVNGHVFTYSAATVGNPHCVVLADNPTPEQARRYGPLIECESRFPNRTNVQFMQVLDRNNIRIEIWERGAGYTLASGSSSTAAAAVAYRLGCCDANITVHMPGGDLRIAFNNGFYATMTGPVTKISYGVLSEEMFATSLQQR